MVTRSVQLSEFDISYESRGHIKAQALVDFITKMTATRPTVEEDNEWFLSMDRASNQTGSRARVILEGPNGVLIDNNQTEYEALLVGMRLTKELEAKTLTTKSELRLVTGQVNVEYQAKDP
ncbi:hypothetical protein CR513_12139, partial [Mucuna pruriens]